MENNDLLLQVTAKAKTWLSDKYDADTRKEVQALLDKEDKTELIEAFYKDLEFGTGGLRGIMGVGTNRVNIYTIGGATQGLSNYLLKEFSALKQIKVVIGHDCRNNSRKYAEISAEILSANGIKAYLFEDLRPTPEVSYAIRKLGAQSGIMITASHNPKVYNGYKAYWDDGAQVTPPHDKNIIAEVNRVNVENIKFKGNKDLIEVLKKDMDDAYIADLKTLMLSPESVKRHGGIGIVYTPLHGTGLTIIPKAMKACGFTNIINVPEQDVLSGEFPTVVSPNPEDPAAMAMALKKGEETNAELVFATDPDADRFGAAIRNDKGEFILLNGNQTMLVLIYYIITRKKELGQLTGKEYTVRTIVTSALVQTVSEKNGVEMFECYTGFKWIASVMRDLEGKRKYIGGGEESYGFLAEDFVRDKDSVSAAILFGEIAAWAKDNGKTLYEMLQDIYVEYGFSKEKGISVVKEGRTGAEEIEAMMKNFRENPIKQIAGSKVTLIKDFVTLKANDLELNEEYTLEMPTTSNVLQYMTEDKTKVSIRPSGTEPKIKFYIEVHSKLKSRAEFDAVDAAADKKIEQVCKDLGI
ncbi:phosphoglucomutase [Dysgonomonas sp. PFB1-18]|uniref:phospho-sugar mutase n=1 Tax=unclassified Dysgonomonas TaxID=2630389 RepID=UPI002473E396|nr:MULTISPECIES: phospho-sugar mutase [unclassified Dysgonomonas]MDL2303008.1 phospho-sugar mutase [Dysgonomonas sp. OttesenSCG-928-D17]MDH6309578.1 phosphoglucomutase [Dysgonomonas sp. PF1-14]MDH6339094.1 phosphoglucomutase [Dysgonomonas sp. PF1-16]MDH6380620.1 phosphoglucomutase [Dysgonomonas sp. PFB1-18]MDH6398116.1 phosphoglucomutase [Dysgonomonas sp. PF1-23]